MTSTILFMALPGAIEINLLGVPALRKFWDLKKKHVTWNLCLPDCSKSTTNAIIPHLHVHKPKTVVVETMYVIFFVSGGPPVQGVPHLHENH